MTEKISIKTKELIPYMQLYDFCTKKYGVKFPPSVSMCYEEAHKYGCNGTLLVLWACVRSQGYTSKEYKENNDIFRLGGYYATFRSAYSTGAAELSKFTDTSMMQQEDQAAVEQLWSEAWEYSRGAPVPVEPPPPPQKPTQPPKEEPPVNNNDDEQKQPEDKEKKPTNWKMIISIVSGLLAAAALVTKFIPGVIDDAVVSVLKMIVDAIQQAF